jgi:hypothetical protein
MIAEGLKANRTLLGLFLVRRFYHYIALDVYDMIKKVCLNGFEMVACSILLMSAAGRQ